MPTPLAASLLITRTLHRYGDGGLRADPSRPPER
jgi:hypothetical protein